MANAPKKKRGRPSKFKKEYVEIAKQLGFFGHTDEHLAKIFSVSVKTIEKWKNNYPEFGGALKEGKTVADERVERSLYERANGYSHPEDKIFYDSKTGEVIVQPTTKHYPPDATSMIFWLKNRQPEKWRDKQEMEIKTPPEGISISINVQGRVEKVGDSECK